MICKIGVRQVPVDSIVVGQRWRTPRPIKVEEMRVSLRDNGLLSPIGVRLVEEEQKESSSAPVAGSSSMAPPGLRRPSLRAG